MNEGFYEKGEGDLEDIGIIIMNEWLSDFDGMCYFEWIEVVWNDD